MKQSGQCTCTPVTVSAGPAVRRRYGIKVVDDLAWIQHTEPCPAYYVAVEAQRRQAVAMWMNNENGCQR